MQHIRRTLLSTLALVVVVAALTALPGTSKATPIARWEPLPTAPQTSYDPNTGEPDSGRTNPVSTKLTVQRESPDAPTRNSAGTTFTLRWTAMWLWLRGYLGIGGGR